MSDLSLVALCASLILVMLGATLKTALPVSLALYGGGVTGFVLSLAIPMRAPVSDGLADMLGIAALIALLLVTGWAVFRTDRSGCSRSQDEKSASRG
jgi:hypothetical protein